jgi:hypothetical protein
MNINYVYGQTKRNLQTMVYVNILLLIIILLLLRNQDTHNFYIFVDKYIEKLHKWLLKKIQETETKNEKS